MLHNWMTAVICSRRQFGLLKSSVTDSFIELKLSTCSCRLLLIDANSAVVSDILSLSQKKSRFFFLFIPNSHKHQFQGVTSGFTRLSMRTKYVCLGLISPDAKL